MNKKFAWLAISGSIGLLLNGCSQAPPASTSAGPDTNKSAASPANAGKSASDKPGKTASDQPGQTLSSTAGSADKATNSAQGEGGQTKPSGQDSAQLTAQAAADTGKNAADAGQAPSNAGQAVATAGGAGTAGGSKGEDPLKLKPGQKNVNVDELPSDMNILTISGEPVTVGEYRRMYKMQQVQLESLVMTNPQVRANFLQQASKMKISLTPDEKSKLTAAAHKSKAPDEAGFQKFLKENKLTADQFDKEICDIGLAVKTVNTALQQSLLNDLVNRELLCRFGKEAGLSGKAMSSYMDFKHSPQYKQMADASGLSNEGLRDEILKNELSRLMLEKIQARASVSDKDLQQAYNKNKSKFQHKERIRLSQIIVAAPTADGNGIQSVRTQLSHLKEGPKLEGKDLDEKVKQVMDVQRQKATAILSMAKSGKNFADLANQLSDDMQAKKNKTGGDMGYQDKDQLIPEFAKAIWPMKAGQVYDGLVQTAIGFSIVKVTEHQGAGEATFAEVKPQLKALLLQQKQQQIVNNWLADKRRNAALVLAPQFASLLQQSSANQTSSLNSTLPR